MARVIIYSGKGGTGKTTISASTAALLAQQGKRVLVLSSDPAHSLADVLGVPLSREEPTEVAAQFYGMEVDTVHEWRRNLGGFQQFVASSYSKRGIERSTATELANQPGLDEILALQRVMTEAKSDRWDAIVLDTAPTGNTLRLLAYPELIIGGNLGKTFFRAYRSISNVARPFVSRTSGHDVPDDRFFDEVRTLLDQMEQLSVFLLDPGVSIRLVLNPEKLPILETRRAYTFLNLYGLLLDAVVINKILPRQANLGSYFDYWVNLQQNYIAEIEASFAPTPLFKTTLQASEPIGIKRLLSVGAMTFGDNDPGLVLYDERPIWLEQWNDDHEPGYYELCLRLPFVEGSAIAIERCGTELAIALGNETLQRTIALPRILYNCRLSSHRYEEGILRLEFHEDTTEDCEEKPSDTVQVEAA
jgi:arsenite-transporting ATPase